MKKLKIVGIFLLILTVLIAGSIFMLGKMIDPNKYKGRISQLVYAKTGKVLVINGNMHWSYFPWIGLKANDLVYYNEPNFTPKTFISAKEMDIKVKLTPLISGKIEVGNITLNNVLLNLIKNKSGQFNWQMITKQDKKQEENLENKNKNQSAIATLSIASLSIKNGRLNWYDEQKNTHTFINALNINSKHIKFDQSFPLSLQFDLVDDHKTKKVSLEAETDIILSSDYKQYSLKNISMKGQYFTSNGHLNFKANGNLHADTNKQTLLANMDFVLNNLKGNINLNGDQISKDAHFVGTLTADEFNLKSLLNDLGKPLDTKKNEALTSLSLLGKFEASNTAFQIQQLHAKIDQTDVYGNLSINTKNQNVHFNLSANQIALDDYLSKDDESKDKQSKSSQEVKETGSPSSPWLVNGVLKIENFKTDKLKLNNLIANIDMRKKVIHISPLHANLYDGQLEGSVTVDKHLQNKTAISIKQSLKNINIKKLLHEFSDSDKLSGTTNITADLTSVTDANTSFLSALNGKINFTLSNGSLQGVDVIYQLSRAHSFIKRLPSPSITDSKQTEFSSLTANAVVSNGVITTDDLTLNSEYLKVNGKGTTNLINKDIQYHLNALAQPKLAEENKDIGKEITIYQVPIKVTGKLTKPNVNLDFAELAKILLTKQIEKPIKETIEKNLDHFKNNLKDQVGNKLKDLSPVSLFDKLTHTNKETEQVDADESTDHAASVED